VTPSDHRILSLLFLCAAVMFNFGNISAAALASVIVATGLAILSFSSRPVGRPLPRAAAVGTVIALGATTLFYNRFLAHPVFLGTFALLATAIVLYSVAKATPAKALALGLAAVSLVLGIAANLSWGSATIDVFQLQQAAAQALLHAHNPYSPTVPSLQLVAPGVPAWLQLHFPYGPILPVLEAPFRLLGDIRVLHLLAALVISAAVLVLARRAGTLGRSACVVMAFPLTAGMVLYSWVDVITMAGVAVWLVSFRTHPKIATAALVVALLGKPTTVIALVPIVFWSVRARRQVITAALIAAAFVLPFAMATGFSQFIYNVLGVDLAVLPRPDSLTFNAYLVSLKLPLLPFAVSAVVVALTAVLVLRRRPATYGDLLTGTAVLAIVSFLVAKWAHFNYYYIPAILLMLAIAGDGLALDTPEMIAPPAALVRSAAWCRAAANRLLPRRPVRGALTPGRDPG
jgi:hypothetical protein